MNEKKICILLPKLTRQDNSILFENAFLINRKEYVIKNYFSLNIADALVIDRIDSAVVALLRFALVNGYDIESVYPISEELYYNINEFIGAVCTAESNIRRIAINIPVTGGVEGSNKNIVGTGISCGVDSLYTVYNHLNANEHTLNHLMYFDIGAHLTKELAVERKKLAESFAKDINMPLVTVDSNLPDIINEIGRYDHILYHTYMMASLILCMQKRIKYYYYSSGYAFHEFKLHINEGCAKYDLLLLDTFSINGIRMYSTGGESSRIDKVKSISNFPLSYKYLNVCVASPKNEGCCFKCVRTLLELDALGVVDKYSQVFDIDFYKRNRDKYLYRLYYRTKFVKGDTLMSEIYPFFADKMTLFFKIKALVYLTYKRLRHDRTL